MIPSDRRHSLFIGLPVDGKTASVACPAVQADHAMIPGCAFPAGIFLAAVLGDIQFVKAETPEAQAAHDLTVGTLDCPVRLTAA